jgi:ubiquinone/menaquinone biosynthesis C-methylase UbiE
MTSVARRPGGFFGRLFGWVRGCFGDGMIRKTVELLDVRPADRVLEIGFGDGQTLQQLARRAKNGFVAGIDSSGVMVRQAEWCNQPDIRSGHVEVKLASVSNIPYADEEFDKVCAVNSLPFWPDPDEDLKEVRRVMRAGGRLVLAVPAKSGDHAGYTPEQLDAIQNLLGRVGFQDVELKVRKAAANLVAKK